MKRSGRHPDRELSAVRVKSLSDAGRYADGNGLYLVVEETGAKRWLLRTVVQGRRRDIGLGSAQLVSLSDARESAQRLRGMARQGGDPLAERRRERRVTPTFSQAAEEVHQANTSAWKNAKHAAQWISTLRQHAFPLIGERRIDDIAPADLLKVLAPIWLTKAETARRVRQRIGAVMDWAKAAGFRPDNPIDRIEKALPRQADKGRHFAAMAYAEVPDFVRRLRGSSAGESVKLAFELLILTAVRTSELLNARWGEFDLEAAIWTIPAERMKAARKHRVPLSSRALELLDAARKSEVSSELVFPGRLVSKPISNMAFLMTLRRTGDAVTAHGFRSAFRDWASECTDFPREVCEMALAHSLQNKVEAAYRRGDLLEKRRDLMGLWAQFVSPDDVVPADQTEPR